jgi:hypothetical protein
MSFYDTQTYCGIVDMKVVVVGICNKINFTKVWITLQLIADEPKLQISLVVSGKNLASQKY